MFNMFEQIALTNKRKANVKNTGKDSKSRSRFILPVTAGLMASPMSVSADWTFNNACQHDSCVCKPSELQFASPAAQLNDDGQFPIVLEADDVAADGENIVTLTGNAEVSQGRQTIVADQIQYYRDTERVVAKGNIEFISDSGDYISADAVDFTTSTSIGTLSESQFKLAKGINSADGIDTVQIDSRGSAKAIHLEGEGYVSLENAKYTNCVEGNDSVLVSAGKLDLDRVSGIGRARNATVRFYGVPILYTPYISFPINDQRKTGFLTPKFGSDEDSGNIIEFPWYWNIANNQDATITPRYYTDRGFQLGAEYRLLTKSSLTTVYGEVLFDDELFGDDRELFQLDHKQQFTENLSASINYNYVSDSEYFQDLSTDVSSFSAAFVPQEAQIDYTSKFFNISARFSEFQVIDPDINLAGEPLERLPEITFNTRFPRLSNGLKYGLTGSFTNYNSDFETDGTRLVLSPYIEQSFETAWGYIKPALTVNYRAFDLGNVESGVDDSPSFVVPAFSIDTGLFFDKSINWFGAKATQTIEPRLFYAYAPDEDQSDVPLFDTSNVNLNNVSNIFRVNRFFGQDRFSDNNQLTLGLTTRVISDKTGTEHIKASVGQVYYLDDLEQNLVSGEVVEEGVGDFLAELKVRGNGNWSTYSFIQYNHDDDEIRTARFDLSYEPLNNPRKRLSVGYFFSDLQDSFIGNSQEGIDQLTLNVHWPIANRWQFTAEERYSLEDSESLFRDVAIEYNACCWKLRLKAQERIRDFDIDDKRTSVFLELELTSLGSIRSGL